MAKSIILDRVAVIAEMARQDLTTEAEYHCGAAARV